MAGDPKNHRAPGLENLFPGKLPGLAAKLGERGRAKSPEADQYPVGGPQMKIRPVEIRQATPTTDTYSAPTSQEEFFFRMPFEVMDPLWYALEHGISAAEAAQAMDLAEDQVQRAYADLARKQRTTQYLRTLPLAYG